MAAWRILFIENSIGLSGSTMSLTTLLNGLDRARFDPVIAVSRPEQAAHLREHLREPAPVVVIGPGNGLKYRGWMTRLTEAGSPLPAMVRHTLLRVAGLIDLAVVDVLKDPARREQLAAAGLAGVKLNHDWGSLLARLESLVTDPAPSGTEAGAASPRAAGNAS